MAPVIGLVGAWAVLAGLTVLIRVVRAHPSGSEDDVYTFGEFTLATVSRVFVGMALLAGGGALVYFELATRGIVQP